MKKVKIIDAKSRELIVANLKDLSLFEEKMTKIKSIKDVRRNLDKTFLISSIEELGLEGKKISAKRVKRVFKKVLTKMIEEVEE